MQGTLMVGPASVERLWRRYAGGLLSYAVTLVGDRAAAEDVLQSVFARLLEQGVPSVVESERSYLCRSVRNEALNVLRGDRRRRDRHDSFLRLPPEDPRDQAELAEIRRRIEDAVAALPADQREAVVLKTWGDLSFPEIAAVVGISEDAAEHRYYRGIDALKKTLETSP
jgi:RNA polymerase sigma-70 factor (ECF subfamily)